tara:strand:+ start:37 stop:267 length:231 start_codon:yes stop_codon:yes gene_type:complete
MNIFELQPFDKLQLFPIANIIHVILGMLMYDYNFLFWIIIFYTFLKVLIVKNENIIKRLPSLIEVYIGLQISKMIK